MIQVRSCTSATILVYIKFPLQSNTTCKIVYTTEKLINFQVLSKSSEKNFVIENAMAMQFSVFIKSNQKQPSCKKRCGPQKGHGEKTCEIQGGGQDMAVMVG